MGNTFIDITGNKYNELEAIECINSKERIWLWKCTCGEKCLARKNDVVSGKKKSCGHLSNRGKAIINIGDKFNEWTVLENIGNRKFLCRCSCGKERPVHSYDLRKGNSKSCGHSSKGESANGRKDMCGQQVGEWTIGKYLGDGFYECTCSCGKIKNLRGTYLRTGESKSCGHATNSFKDLTDKQFGEWTALKYKGNYMWECKCSCGKIKDITSYDLTHGKSTNCGHTRTPQILNKRFGKLKVLSYLGNNYWECACDCGNITNALTNNLVNGNKLSCGCLIEDKKKIIKENIQIAIQNFIASNAQLPFIEDIAIATQLTPTTVHKYVNELKLNNYINKTFSSKPERDIYNFINQFTKNIVLHDRKILNGKELDIYIPEKKLAIEFNGSYWHSSTMVDKYYHQQKTIDCAKQGIQLIHIFEYEWEDLDKQVKIENYIKRLLTKDNQIKVYARSVQIKPIINEIANSFCERYHLQGKANASINLGCYKDTELLGVMTFGSPRFNNRYEYEIVRMCWRNDVEVVGGAEKLFKYFLKNYNPTSIITYSDISKFTGNIYTRLGFKPIQPNPITEPNYIWINTLNNIVFTRYQTQKSKLIEQGLGTEQQTEKEIMESNDFIQVFDCGNIRLEYNIK